MSAHVAAIVQGLVSDDNATRQQAEKAYESAKKANLGPLLVELGRMVGRSDTDSATRGVVAVFLRKLIFDQRDADFARAGPAAMAELKQQLVAGFRAETRPHTVKQVCAAIASLAQNNQWPNSVEVFLGHAEQAAAPAQVAAFLTLLDNLCQFANELVVPLAGRILAFVNKGLAAGAVELKLPAIKCAASLVYALSATNPELIQQGKFTAVCGAVLDGVVVLLKGMGAEGGTDRAEEALKALEVLARQVPTNFKPLLAKLCGVCSQVAAHPAADPALRAMALEVLKSVATGAGAMVRKFPEFITTAVRVSLQMLAEVSDADWDGATCDAVDEDDQAPWRVAGDAMAAFADDIGRPLVPVLFSMVPALLTNAAWQRRYAALMAISRVVGSEACTKIIQPKLEGVVKMVAPALQDGHQRNRWVAVDTLGILITAFGGRFQKTYHAVVGALARCIQGADGSCLRVRAHAANTVGMFCHNPDDCEEEHLRPYLTPLLKSLVNLVQTGVGHPVAQTRALAAVAQVAEIVDDEFSPFYQGFMKVLKQVLAVPVTEATLDLHCAAFIAVGKLGSAVGPETFGPDAQAVMQAIFQVLRSKGPSRDQQMVAVMQCACQICRTMGPAFARFLPNIVEALVAQATQEVQYNFQVLGTNDGENKASQKGSITTSTFNMRGLGDMKVDLNTSQMEEKYTALELLGEYASAVPDEFARFAPNVLRAVLPRVNEVGYSLVRQNAAHAAHHVFASLLRGVRVGTFPSAKADAVVRQVAQELLQALQKEKNADVACSFAEAIMRIVKACHESGGPMANGVQPPPLFAYPAALVDGTLQQLVGTAARSVKRRAQAQANAAKLGADVYDEEEALAIADEMDAEEELMTHVTDAIGFLVKQHKAAILPALEAHVVPAFTKLLDAHQYPASLQHNAICFFDDLIEHCSPACHRHLPTCSGAIIKNIVHEEQWMRCAALYGVGMLVEHAPAFAGRYVPTIVQRLTALISAPEAREEDNVVATDNAVSALGKILEKFPAQCDAAKLWPMWLQYLPLRDDDVEAKVVHAQLVRLIKAKNPLLLPAAAAPRVLPQVAKVIVEVLAQEDQLADRATAASLAAVLKQLMATPHVPQAAVQGFMAGLTDVERGNVTAAMK